jgi:hypothetical protein
VWRIIINRFVNRLDRAEFREPLQLSAGKRSRGLIAVLVELLDGNPVLSLGRNIKFLTRYLYGFVCIGGLDGPKVFSALEDDVYTPARHQLKTLPVRLDWGRLLLPVRARIRADHAAE